MAVSRRSVAIAAALLLVAGCGKDGAAAPSSALPPAGRGGATRLPEVARGTESLGLPPPPAGRGGPDPAHLASDAPAVSGAR